MSVYKILLVDDTAFDRLLISSLLKKSGRFEVLEAVDGKQALELLQTQPFDLLLSDLMMPDMSGIELIRQTDQDLPSIVMTAFGSEAAAMEAMQAGAYSYVSKTRARDDLVKEIDSVLHSARQKQQQADLMDCVTQQQVTLEIRNDIEQIHTTIDYIEQLINSMNLFCGAQPMHLRLCLEEALSNAIIHGNLEVSSELRDRDDDSYQQLIKERNRSVPYRNRRVTVEIDLNRYRAEFVIRDEGPGFDISSLPDPLIPANLQKPSGRGITLMHAFLSEVQYNDWGNEVRLVMKTPARCATSITQSIAEDQLPNLPDLQSHQILGQQQTTGVHSS